MRAWYARNKVLCGLIALCVAAAIAGTLVITVTLSNRPKLTEADKDRALAHCAKWMGEYTKAPNPIIRCTDALKDDPEAFYFRWAPGR